MHPLPSRHRKGRQADGGARLEQGSVVGIVGGNARGFHLRAGTGRTQFHDLSHEVFPNRRRPGPKFGIGERSFPMSSVKFSIDGVEVEANADETIWQVAARNAVEIPHLCYSPAPSYRPDGNCRACMVEIEGERVLAA